MKKKSQLPSTRLRIAVVVSDFNTEITGGLLTCCVDTLEEAGIPSAGIHIVRVPGAYELPYAAHRLANRRRFDAVICLGCVIKGETSHDVHVATWASVGIGQVSIATGVPTLFGVLTPNNEAQARRRSRPGPMNRGREVAEAALRMIDLRRRKEI